MVLELTSLPTTSRGEDIIYQPACWDSVTGLLGYVPVTKSLKSSLECCPVIKWGCLDHLESSVNKVLLTKEKDLGEGWGKETLHTHASHFFFFFSNSYENGGQSFGFDNARTWLLSLMLSF